MTRTEREAFLADLHVGVLSVAGDADRGPDTLPIWYTYEPGGTVTLSIDRTSRKARLVQQTGRASFCVQKEQLPYKYVSIEGPIVLVNDPAPREVRRAVVTRYLGPEGAEAFLVARPELAELEVEYQLRPERWSTQDFSEDPG
jgi:nitroimidazol reductase NimA-like FMN-containing flavoprotein (pyridoxamine 5'-phosphate oxidase superfamily)